MQASETCREDEDLYEIGHHLFVSPPCRPQSMESFMWIIGTGGQQPQKESAKMKKDFCIVHVFANWTTHNATRHYHDPCLPGEMPNSTPLRMEWPRGNECTHNPHLSLLHSCVSVVSVLWRQKTCQLVAFVL